MKSTSRLVAVGITNDGKKVNFIHPDTFVAAFCTEKDLKSLEVKDGITRVYCYGNTITKLKLAPTVMYLKCDKEIFDYDECKISHVDIQY